MTTFQDCSIGLAKESTYGTPVTVARWLEFVDESLDLNKVTKQGEGLRVASRVARSARRVVVTSDAGGDFSMECISKGMGLLWEQCLGSSASTLVSGSTYQQVHTLGDTMPSATWQKGLPRFDGNVDAYTYSGGTVDSFEVVFDQAAIARLKVTLDAKDITTATGYAAPSYPTSPNLFHFANGSLSTGTFTAPTSTALAAGATPLTNVRSGSIKVSHGISDGRYNYGNAGKKMQPKPGLREITGSLVVEYDSATFRDAILNDSAMSLILNFTGGALSTGTEQLQVALPEIKLDGKLPAANGGDEILLEIDFTVLDNLAAAQPMWVVCRTADAAL